MFLTRFLNLSFIFSFVITIEWLVLPCSGQINTSNCSTDKFLSSRFELCISNEEEFEDPLEDPTTMACFDSDLCTRNYSHGEGLEERLGLAFGLTATAILATSAGALVPFLVCIRSHDTRYLSSSLGLSAGVLLYYSFTDLLIKARNHLCCVISANHAHLVTAGVFFLGILTIVLLDLLLKCDWRNGVCAHCRRVLCCTLKRRRGRRRGKDSNSVRSSNPSHHQADTSSTQLPLNTIFPISSSGAANHVRSDEDNLMNSSEYALDRTSVSTGNDSGNLHYSVPDNDRHIERRSISAASNANSNGTNHIGDASIQDLLSNTSIHRLNAVIPESAFTPGEACSHVSLSLMNETEDGSIRAGQTNGEIVSRASAPSLQLQRIADSDSVNVVQHLRPQEEEQLRVAPPQSTLSTTDITHLRHTTLLIGLAIALLNLPGGVVTFIAVLSSTSVGVALAVVVLLHNAIEGVCVSMATYYTLGSRLKAFLWTFLLGAHEILGALLAWLILQFHSSTVFFGLCFSLSAGLLVGVSLKELLPTAHKFDRKGLITSALLVSGMLASSGSLLLVDYTST